jgi:hypothetical protein
MSEFLSDDAVLSGQPQYQITSSIQQCGGKKKKYVLGTSVK